ncbi:hypothetical protein HMN09_00313300 [Mycena chlorophos]|uniref:Uncharacterized protein n=1 Tax=Mycena chlorophos TaxID=658473 RepID=A0A8H6TJX8_MYCCL|nr:hypothetical protein HMN09_00313300 [Mycena chlorophos]
MYSIILSHTLRKQTAAAMVVIDSGDSDAKRPIDSLIFDADMDAPPAYELEDSKGQDVNRDGKTILRPPTSDRTAYRPPSGPSTSKHLDAPTASTSSSYHSSSPSTAYSDEQWTAKLAALETRIESYTKSRKRSDEAVILASMHDLAASHPDPKVQQYWAERAAAFESAKGDDKVAALRDIGQAFKTIVAAPLVIAGMVLEETESLLKTSTDWLNRNTTASIAKGKDLTASYIAKSRKFIPGGRS